LAVLVVALPETGDLPSAFHRVLGKKDILPSAAETTLNKIMALDIPSSLLSA